MEELILCVDTSTPGGSVALCQGESVLAEHFRRLPGTHTDWLLQAIDSMLEDAAVSLAELSMLAVVRGPGSFTGLRVGMATVKGLAIGSGLPVVGVSALQLLAAAVTHVRVPVCAMLDARKKEVYAGLYDTTKGHPQALGPERVCDPETLLDSLAGEILFLGDGAEVYRSLIVRKFGPRAHFAGPAFSAPGAARAAALALAVRDAGELEPLARLSPSYIRPSEAELNWLKQHPGG